jgi:hypothetical protein
VRAISEVISQVHPKSANACLEEVIACPYTLRLLRYLLDGNSDSNFGRSESPIYPVRIRQIHNSGHSVAVDVGWSDGGSQVIQTTTFLVDHEHTGWLVDDQYCSGHPKTTIRGLHAGPCR